MGNIIFEHQYTIEGYVTFAVHVKSGKFSGMSNFCIAESVLKDAILYLSEMYDSLKGMYRMNDYDSDDFMLFEFLNHGRMRISGQIGGSHSKQYLKYQFVTDQTVLGIIVSDFKRLRVLQSYE